MFKVVEYLSDDRIIIHGYDDNIHDAQLRYDYVTTMGRTESFSYVAIEKASR